MVRWYGRRARRHAPHLDWDLLGAKLDGVVVGQDALWRRRSGAAVAVAHAVAAIVRLAEQLHGVERC